MKPRDIRRVAETAQAHGQRILEHYLPGGKRQGKEYVVRNPKRDDQHSGSLSIEIASGKGGDFATGDTFGDFVGMVAWHHGCAMGEAAEDLARFLGLPITATPAAAAPAKNASTDAWHNVCPVPTDAPPPPKAHPTKGLPDHVFEYRDTDNRLQGVVMRFEARGDERKYFTPLTYWSNGRGREEWRFKTWAGPHPLFGLNELSARPAATVFIHEGEKATLAGRALLPEAVHLCWPGGANAIGKADYSPLAGRAIVLWPDHDEPGRRAMVAVAKAARKAGAEAVRIINLQVFAAKRPNAHGRLDARAEDLPDGWDAADAVAEGWTPELFAELLQDAATFADAGESAPAEPAPEAAASEAASPFVNDAAGLYYVEHDRDNKVRQTRVCGPLKVLAIGRDAEAANWGPAIEFRDRDGRRRQEVLPYRLLVGDGHDAVKLLADLGLEIMPGRKPLDLAKQFILSATTERRAITREQSGWHNGAFLFPDGAVGETDDVLLYRGNRRALAAYASRGELQKWQQIAHLATNNPHLMFVLSVAFAGPLLNVLGHDGMAFHLVGDSSIGKSGALVAASSVWGPPSEQMHSWRSTSNALEYVAAAHNDAALILDELNEVDPKEAGAITYMLANAKGKGRAHHAGGLREPISWRIMLLSSGELGLADHLASANQKHFAGQAVRFIEIEADAGLGHGMWHDVTGCPDGGRQFTDILKKHAARYHGTAGRAFVGELVKRIDEVRHRWREHDAAFCRAYKPEGAAGQVLRVMGGFALVAFAGELAAQWQITTWDKGASIEAAGALFRRWCAGRPSVGNAEEAQIIAHVRSVLERNWQARFIDWKRVEEESADLSRMSSVHDALGFRKKNPEDDFHFYITRQRFRDEFAARGGFDPKRVSRLLKEKGVLKCDADSTTLSERLPNGDPRSYCIRAARLWRLQ